MNDTTTKTCVAVAVTFIEQGYLGVRMWILLVCEITHSRILFFCFQIPSYPFQTPPSFCSPPPNAAYELEISPAWPPFPSLPFTSYLLPRNFLRESNDPTSASEFSCRKKKRKNSIRGIWFDLRIALREFLALRATHYGDVASWNLGGGGEERGNWIQTKKKKKMRLQISLPQGICKSSLFCSPFYSQKSRASFSRERQRKY